MEAEQRANQKVSHLVVQYENRYSELRTDLEADCKRIVGETIDYARRGMEEFKNEEHSVIQEMRDECDRQELKAAELNFQLQDRVDELVEKLNKYSAPKLRIEELDQGPGDVQFGMFATPKSASAKAGATPKPNTAMTDLAADAREKLHSLFSTTPAGSAAPPKLPNFHVQRQHGDNANQEPSVHSRTIAASEPEKLKGTDVVGGLSGQQLLDFITRLTSKDSEGEKPRAKEAETIKLHDMPAPEAYRQCRNHVRDEVKSCSDKPDEAWIWLSEVFDNKTPQEKLEEKLQDPGKFITLDTKLSAALTTGNTCQRLEFALAITCNLARSSRTSRRATCLSGRGRAVLLCANLVSRMMSQKILRMIWNLKTQMDFHFGGRGQPILWTSQFKVFKSFGSSKEN